MKQFCRGKTVLVTLRWAAAVLALHFASWVAAHEGHDHGEAPASVAASGLARLPDGSVTVPKLAQRRLRIRTVLASPSEASAVVQLNGRVIMDPNAGGRVQAVHGGRVEPGPHGLPVPGQAVRKGQVLAFVRHHTEPYAQADQKAQLAEIKANRMVAEQRLQRLEALEGTVARKELEAARAELASLRERERFIGASLHVREALVAPVSGVISRAEAVSGQVVDEREVLFEIIDPARVLVEAGTGDMGLASRIEGGTLLDVEGAELRFLGAARSLRDGLLPLTFRLETKAGQAPPALAVGQPVTVVARYKDRVKGVVLPAQSIVRDSANEPVVWVKASAERFMPQPVGFQPLDAQNVVVTRGLQADQRVVVRGASLLGQIR